MTVLNGHGVVERDQYGSGFREVRDDLQPFRICKATRVEGIVRCAGVAARLQFRSNRPRNVLIENDLK